MKHNAPGLVVAASLFVWVCGCNRAAPTEDGSIASAELIARAEVDPDHPTIVHVTIEAPLASATYVRFGHDGALDHTTPVSELGTSHAHQLRGLKAGRSVSWQAVAETDGGEEESEVFTVDIPSAPDGLPELTVVTSDPAADMRRGYLLAVVDVGMVPATDFYLAIIDGDGDYVWWHELPDDRGTSGATPSLDGRGIVYGEVDNQRQQLDGVIVELALDGEELSRTSAPGLHHAVAELPGGRYAYPNRVFLEPPTPDLPGEWLLSDTIVVVPEGDDGSNAVTLFDFYADWWDSDFDNYWKGLCDEIFVSIFGREDVCEVTHTNSISWLADDGALYVYERRLETLLRIDAETGELLWQLSGKYSDFTLPDGAPAYIAGNTPVLWSYPHFSHVWSGGLLVFDNGVMYTPPHSSLVEYVWDEDAGTVAEVWRYQEPEGGYTEWLGDARKLVSGHVLGSWMSLSQVTEVTSDGVELWRLELGGANARRIHYLVDLYDLSVDGQR